LTSISYIKCNGNGQWMVSGGCGERVVVQRWCKWVRRASFKNHKCQLTGVNVRDNHLGALVGKQARRLGADALPAARDNGHLPGEHAARVVEVRGELRDAVCHDESCV